ncbi:HalOD1 output domain-containing protein [Halorarius litoreus]|uniref:HalOD1 output domain-containing protein n=1 Tax=Halorarius litoreus TaxID=2962676 RepID=UPI0020CC03B9|nr:HalOD1 output domain-containing protein [Halorarius litoreus]
MTPESNAFRTDETHVYHATPTESPSEAVIHAVLDASNREPPATGETLPPLYDAVDPDALDALLGRHGATPTVRFSYSGYDVMIDGSGAVRLVEA